MLRQLTRTQSWLLLCGLALVCAWSVVLGMRAPTAPLGISRHYSDVQLYRDVAARIAAGQDYYAAATSLHRMHGFPTIPFFTVRLPTLATAAAQWGWTTLQVVLGLLLTAALLVWYGMLEGAASRLQRVGVIVLMILGGAMVTQSALVAQHDQWAGLLLTLAIPLRGGRYWPWAVACAGAALAIRELAIAFVLLALVFAMWERRWREAAAWSALVLAFVAGMAWHAKAVLDHVLPDDLHSPGWNGLRGPAGTLSDLTEASLLNALPPALAGPILVLALFGWAGAPRRLALFTVLWLVGFGTALALFGRPDTSYWAIELLPAWFLGLAFLPRALRDLAAGAFADGKQLTPTTDR